MTAPLPCPVCSGPPRLEIPTWAAAHRSSVKRGVRCGIFTGCRHVDTLAQHQIVELPQAEALIVRWNEEAERLFTERTVTWTDCQRAAFRQRLRFPETRSPA